MTKADVLSFINTHQSILMPNIGACSALQNRTNPNERNRIPQRESWDQIMEDENMDSPNTKYVIAEH
tara:strand:+ start:1736 stop:1936 length:201 start_codon:yes stop_codon:yes gene_type:complete